MKVCLSQHGIWNLCREFVTTVLPSLGFGFWIYFTWMSKEFLGQEIKVSSLKTLAEDDTKHVFWEDIFKSRRRFTEWILKRTVSTEMLIVWVNQNKLLLNKILRRSNLIGIIRMGGEVKFKLIFETQVAERGVTTYPSKQNKPLSKGGLEWDKNKKSRDWRVGGSWQRRECIKENKIGWSVVSPRVHNPSSQALTASQGKVCSWWWGSGMKLLSHSNSLPSRGWNAEQNAKRTDQMFSSGVLRLSIPVPYYMQNTTTQELIPPTSNTYTQTSPPKKW